MFPPSLIPSITGNTLLRAYDRRGISKADVVIFVSPESNIGYYKDFIRAATPRLVVLLIHEPMMPLA
jgi:hypothetical protein